MQSTPFRPVLIFGEELFNFSPDFPRLETLALVLKGGMGDVPNNSASPVPTNPLAINVKVNIHISIAGDIDR